ncbi:MAG TPA: hypothetical protein VK638_38660 [Edaphobacter sp.]|nr:hypothetical protein [Edaphobacter sp.]
MCIKPSASKTRRIALSLVLSAANVVVIVSIVRSTAGEAVFPLIIALVALSVVTLAQVWPEAASTLAAHFGV